MRTARNQDAECSECGAVINPCIILEDGSALIICDYCICSAVALYEECDEYTDD